MKKLMVLMLALMASLTLVACGDDTVEGDTYLELNPYESVNWDEDSSVLANLHTHTRTSDGDYKPAEVVDMYHEGGYGALAITDHDDDVNNSYERIAYPWDEFDQVSSTWENRDADDLGMIPIEGFEFSYNHHIVGLYTTYRGSSDEDEMEVLKNAFESDDDAVAFMAHPGRYWSVNEEYSSDSTYGPQWYLDFFDAFEDDELLGIEVFNRDIEYENDRLLWDQLLSESMPERPIWGFSNDDFHGFSPDDPGYSKTYHLLNDPTDKDAFRQSLIDGAFYAQHTGEPMGDGPTIASIAVDEDARTITIEVDGEYDRIRWLSGYEDDSQLSGYEGSGETFEYAEFEGNYVRAEIISNEGTNSQIETLLQPFGFVQDPERGE